MIGYVTLGTNDLSRAAKFYDFLFRMIGVRRVMEEPGRYIAWSAAPDRPAMAVAVPYDGERASVGNGTMVALELKSPAEVAAVHALAVALGGKDDGEPGPRDGGKHRGVLPRSRRQQTPRVLRDEGVDDRRRRTHSPATAAATPGSIQFVGVSPAASVDAGRAAGTY